MKQTSTGLQIAVAPFQPIGGTSRHHVEEAFEGLGAWLGASSTTVNWQE